MNRLYVLYDERCGLCRWARRWLQSRPAFVELTFVAAGSDEALRRYPGVSEPGEPEELVVIGDNGQVYRGDSAWIMCLYALRDYREWSLRLASPTLRPLARQAFALVSQQRGRISWWLGLSDEDAARALGRVPAPACGLSAAASRLHEITATHPGAEPRAPTTA